MTKKEYIERNIGMTFDFIKHLLDHPQAIESISDGAEIDFIDKDMAVKIKEETNGVNMSNRPHKFLVSPPKGGL